SLLLLMGFGVIVCGIYVVFHNRAVERFLKRTAHNEKYSKHVCRRICAALPDDLKQRYFCWNFDKFLPDIDALLKESQVKAQVHEKKIEPYPTCFVGDSNPSPILPVPCRLPKQVEEEEKFDIWNTTFDTQMLYIANKYGGKVVMAEKSVVV